MSSNVLLDSFKLFVSEDEKEATDVCLKGEFDSNNEDILEFLSANKYNFKIQAKRT